MRNLKRRLTLLCMAICLLAPVAVIHAASDAGTQANAAEGETKAPLLPDVSTLEPFLQALWVVIIFVILLAVLYPTAWKNVLAGLKKREERIRHDISDAENTRAKAENTLKEYNTRLATAETQVRELITNAAADAEKIAAGIRMRGQQEAEEIKEKALKDIDASRKQALTEIYAQTANLSTSIAEKILKRNLNADDQRDLVNESLEQLQSLNA